MPTMKGSDKIKVGDIVHGADGGWWTITNIEEEPDGLRCFKATNTLTNSRWGYMSGFPHREWEVL